MRIKCDYRRKVSNTDKNVTNILFRKKPEWLMRLVRKPWNNDVDRMISEEILPLSESGSLNERQQNN